MINKKILFVLLAAGDSKRFRGNKLLFPLKGKPMYRYIVDEINEISEDWISGKIIVTQYNEIFENMKQDGYITIRNTRSDLGISHSIHLAMQYFLSDPVLYNKTDGICFSVCDQPWIKTDTVVRLLKEWEQSKKGLACLCNQDRMGNPVIFTKKYIKELLELSGDVGGKKILKLHLDDVYQCQVVDDLQLTDVDERI